MSLKGFPLTQPRSRAELDPGKAGNPAYFRSLVADHRTIHVVAEGDWILTGKTTRTPIHRDPDFKVQMPPGEYTFDFPPASINLKLLVIDPDPGPSTGE